jgi:ribosomal protein L37AE/L43A
MSSNKDITLARHEIWDCSICGAKLYATVVDQPLIIIIKHLEMHINQLVNKK